MNTETKIVTLILVVIGVIGIAAGVTWLFQLLWNAVLPPMFGWPLLTYWQALAILALCSILSNFLHAAKRR